ncbi:mechanosensitive ion channel domain-containing protein [Flagellimonas flava]|uniref:mechanosensitive ion channel domain-containing protein n=1 Tax=Flagellimonas flava TaxID=570519 RepID=UPI003D65D923
MANYQTEILVTIILIAGTILLISIVKGAIKRFGRLAAINVNSRKVVFYFSYLVIYLISITILLIIWGVQLEDFAVFMASVLAILGVGFFAQWSILSNITASVILFFSHPLRLGDRIRILDADFDWTGVVEDISAFYLFMKTDDGRKVTIPTNLVIQKGIEIFDKKASEG